ncbi:hypothetical protein [Gordonibacter sp.]|uniref:hypothetical protein n=1 Tax=Gordonibacter sp. TaxID=1968902 RepID=UPI002FCAF099
MKSKPIGIRFDPAELECIESFAKSHGVTFSEVVRKGAVAYVRDADADRLSLSEVASAGVGEDTTLLFSQFLDDFRHARDKARLIEKEPQWSGDNEGRWPYDLAATAHKLAHDHGLPVPAWALRDKYVAPEPFYAFNTQDPEFREYLEQTTPREFKSHNLFLGENILSRA